MLHKSQRAQRRKVSRKSRVIQQSENQTGNQLELNFKLLDAAHPVPPGWLKNKNKNKKRHSLTKSSLISTFYFKLKENYK